jgi:small GTP-binding protein
MAAPEVDPAHDHQMPEPRGDFPPVITLADFTEDQAIGVGAFGKVFVARRKSDNQRVALKVLFPGQSGSPASFAREVQILWSQNHPTLLKCLGYLPADETGIESAALVLELAEGGSVKTFIQKAQVADGDTDPDPRWTPTRKHIILYGTALGISILHDRGIVHRDLKPENVLLDATLEPKIGDFGSASRDGDNSTTREVGSPQFMAPEVTGSEEYGAQCDVYSFGMFAYNLLTGRSPFPLNWKIWQVARSVHAGERPEIPDTLPPHYKELIEACWNGDPHKRPTMRHVVAILSSCSYLTDIDVPAFLAYRSKLRRKAEIERLPADLENQAFAKVILLGNGGVGKTWLFLRLRGSEITPDIPVLSTIGLDSTPIWTRIRDGRIVRLRVWDTAGQEEHRALTAQYAREANCAVIVFDLRDRQSFEDLSRWIQLLRQHAPADTQILLIATKADCEDRQVRMEEVHAFAKGCGAFSYLEVSGRTGDNVHEIVDQIGAFVRPTISAPVATQAAPKRRCC